MCNPITKREFLGFVERASSKEEVCQEVNNRGFSSYVLSCIGYCSGETNGPAYKDGRASSAEGWAPKFYRSTAEVGSVVQHCGKEWVVVWNSYRNVDLEDEYLDFVMVPAEVFASTRVNSGVLCGR